MTFRSTTLVLTMAVLLLAGGPALADSRRAEDSALSDGVRQVERETRGQVLRADPVQRGDREGYRVKVLTPEGRVRVMHDDRRGAERDVAPRASRDRDGRDRDRDNRRAPPPEF